MEIMAQLENNRERLEIQDRNVFKKKVGASASNKAYFYKQMNFLRILLKT